MNNDQDKWKQGAEKKGKERRRKKHAKLVDTWASSSPKPPHDNK